MNAIEVKGLNKKYQRFSLQDVDIVLPQGYVMGFIGENGAGKSTTIKSILGLVHPDSADIKVLGKGNEEALADVGVVLCDSSFPDNLSVKDVGFILSKVYRNWDENAYAEYVQMFGLDVKQKIGTFSTGMKMKTSLAAALSHNAKLLILDEPTSGLDPVFRDELLDVLLEFMQDEEHSIFFSSHIVGDLEKISDYITMIHDGRILFSEPKDLLLEKYRLISLTDKELGSIDSNLLIGLKKTQFEDKALVLASDFDDKKYHLQKPSIEEIMLYCIKKEELR